jgi:siroheme synthase
VDWTALAGTPGTLVVYMGLSRLDAITDALVSGGMDPSMPAAVVSRATTAEEAAVFAPLAEVASAAQHAGIRAPAIVIVGPTVRPRPIGREQATGEAFLPAVTIRSLL